jgi:hypothetical protein
MASGGRGGRGGVASSVFINENQASAISHSEAPLVAGPRLTGGSSLAEICGLNL